MKSKENNSLGNQNDRDHLINSLANGIFEGKKTSNFLGISTANLENVAFYDFSEYLYVLEPEVLEPSEAAIDDLFISETIIDPNERLFLQDLRARLDELIRKNSRWWFLTPINNDIRKYIIERLISTLLLEIEAYENLLYLYGLAQEIDIITEQEFINWLPIVPKNTNACLYFFTVYQNFVFFLFWIIINMQRKTDDQLKNRWAVIARLTVNHWKEHLEQLLERQREKEAEKGKREKTVIPPFTFDPFLPYSWNLGLRIVYRQEWRSLGNQRGEIVKTIPLGPKQVEKVSTKIVRRIKVTKTAEHLKSIEESSEVTDTTKDSSEIVNEASNTQGWNAEAEASVNFSVFSASASAGAHGEAEERSKKASTHLSESMQKTASKIRTEIKTVVSTESESTFEVETASEIVNPNEEIPITYVYSKLQRQYEIFTSVAEIQNVILIAEPIPYSFEVNFEWVKRYDWIIAKVLLDDSFRDALTSISQVPRPIDYSEVKNTLEDKLGDIIGSEGKEGFLERFSEKLTTLSLSGVDMIQEAQRNYQEALQKKYETEREIELLEVKRERLYQHIRDNILHYCRAIWSQEDSQQRILRYKKLKIQVPVEWDFHGTFGGVEYPLNDEGGEEEGETSREEAGETIDEGKTIDNLLEQVREYETDELEETLFDLDGEFIGDWDTCVDITDLINPAGPIGYYGNYAIYYLKPEFIRSELFTMLQIMKTPYLYYPNMGAKPILMDPELKHFTQDNLNLLPEDINTDDRIDMIDYVPELRTQYTAASESGDEELDEFLNNDDLFKKIYPEYLLRKERSRRFLLDTQNLIIDIEPGTGTALESFKLAHRKIDVLKALEEKEKLRLENERLKALLSQEKLDDLNWQDSEKVIVQMSSALASKILSKTLKGPKDKQERIKESSNKENLTEK